MPVNVGDIIADLGAQHLQEADLLKYRNAGLERKYDERDFVSDTGQNNSPIYNRLKVANYSPSLAGLVVLLTPDDKLENLKRILAVFESQGQTNSGFYEDLLQCAYTRSFALGSSKYEIIEFLRTKMLDASATEERTREREIARARAKEREEERNKKLMIQVAAIHAALAETDVIRNLHINFGDLEIYRRKALDQGPAGREVMDSELSIGNSVADFQGTGIILGADAAPEPPEPEDIILGRTLEQARIEGDRLLHNVKKAPRNKFFQMVTNGLETTLRAYKDNSVKLSQPNLGAADLSMEVANTVADIIGLACPIFGPGLALGIRGATTITQQVLGTYAQDYRDSIATFVSYPMQYFGKVIYAVALRLADKYDNQLQCLNIDEASLFAQCAVFRVIQCIALGLFPKDPTAPELAADLVAAVEAVRLSVAPREVCTRKGAVNMTDEVLFQNTACLTADGKIVRDLFSNTLKQVAAGSSPDPKFAFRYRQATDEEYEFVKAFEGRAPAKVISDVFLGQIGGATPKPPPAKTSKCEIL